MLTREEKKMLIELICNEQTHMIIKNHTRYESDKYKKLEELKVKIKDMGVSDENQMVKNVYCS